MLSEAPFRDVVLLGAGASMAAGLPSAGELTKHLSKARCELESLRVSPTAIEAIDEDIAWLTGIQAHLPPILRHLKGFNANNIEDIFRVWGHERAQSKIEMPGAPPNLIPGYQYPRLIRMLALALAHSPTYPSVHDLKHPNVYSWLIEQLVSNAEPGEQGARADPGYYQL